MPVTATALKNIYTVFCKDQSKNRRKGPLIAPEWHRNILVVKLSLSGIVVPMPARDGGLVTQLGKTLFHRGDMIPHPKLGLCGMGV